MKTNGNGNEIGIENEIENFHHNRNYKTIIYVERSCSLTRSKINYFHISSTYLIASIICKPIFTQFAACVGREMGKPDTQ